MKFNFFKNKIFANAFKNTALFLVVLVLFFAPLSVLSQKERIVAKRILAPKINIAHAESSANNLDTQAFLCGGFFPGQGGSLKECLLYPVYMVFVLSGEIAYIGGWIFDALTMLSLSPKILDEGFVKRGWQATRDLANMLFIFVLLFLSLAMILQLDGYDTKKILSKLILIALLMNFSLFFARVIIDAGNITALFFYNNIPTKENLTQEPSGSYDPAKVFSGNLGLDKTQRISETFAGAIQPQQLLISTSEKYSDSNIKSDWTKVTTLFLIYFSGSILLLAFTWIMFSISFMFLGRIAILWLLMALAPLAFAAMVLPKTQKIAQEWWSELISKSFCITIFLFFLWLIAIFASPANDSTLKKLMDTSGTELNLAGLIVLMSLKFGILIGLLFVARGATKKACGGIHGMSMDIAGKVAGAAGMVAGGGVGALGRRFGMVTKGRLDTVVGENADGSDRTRRQQMAEGSYAERARLMMASAAERGNWDIRTPIAKVIKKTPGAQELGIDASALGKPFEGGARDVLKKREKEYKAYIDQFETDAEKKMAAEYIEKGGALGSFKNVAKGPIGAALAGTAATGPIGGMVAGAISFATGSISANKLDDKARKKAAESTQKDIKKKEEKAKKKEEREKMLISAESKFYEEMKKNAETFNVDIGKLSPMTSDTEAKTAEKIRGDNLRYEQMYNEKLKEKLGALDEDIIRMKANKDANRAVIAENEIAVKQIRQQLNEYKEIEKGRDWLEKSTQREEDVKARDKKGGGEEKKKVA